MSLRIALVVLVVAALCPTTVIARDSLPLDYLAARDRLQIGDTASAISILKNSIQTKTLEMKPRILYLKLIKSTEGVRQAVDLLKRFLTDQPDPDFLLKGMNILDLSRAHRNELLVWSDRQRIDNPGLTLRRIKLLLDQGKMIQARIRLRHAVEKHPDHYDLRLLFVKHRFENMAVDKLEPHIRKLIELDPGRHEGYYWLGKLLERRGESDKAEIYYDRSNALKHGSEPTEE